LAITRELFDQLSSNLVHWERSWSPKSGYVVVTLTQIGQGHKTFWLITLKLYDRLPSNLAWWERLKEDN